MIDLSCARQREQWYVCSLAVRRKVVAGRSGGLCLCWHPVTILRVSGILTASYGFCFDRICVKAKSIPRGRCRVGLQKAHVLQVRNVSRGCNLHTSH